MKMMQMKALIIYGTRGGATKQIADEIGKIFGGQGYDVTVRNAKESKGVDTSKPVDRRDWNAIRTRAADMGTKAKA